MPGVVVRSSTRSRRLPGPMPRRRRGTRRRPPIRRPGTPRRRDRWSPPPPGRRPWPCPRSGEGCRRSRSARRPGTARSSSATRSANGRRRAPETRAPRRRGAVRDPPGSAARCARRVRGARDPAAARGRQDVVEGAEAKVVEDPPSGLGADPLIRITGTIPGGVRATSLSSAAICPLARSSATFAATVSPTAGRPVSRLLGDRRTTESGVSRIEGPPAGRRAPGRRRHPPTPAGRPSAPGAPRSRRRLGGTANGGASSAADMLRQMADRYVIVLPRTTSARTCRGWSRPSTRCAGRRRSRATPWSWTTARRTARGRWPTSSPSAATGCTCCIGAAKLGLGQAYIAGFAVGARRRLQPHPGDGLRPLPSA